MRKIDAFIAEDGTIHTTEGAALRADVLHLLSNTALTMKLVPANVQLVTEVGLAVIENSLGKLLPLLQRLDDPRNKVIPPQPVAREGSEAPVQQADRVELADNHPVPSYVDEMLPDIDPSELRIGQVVQMANEAIVTIDDITTIGAADVSAFLSTFEGTEAGISGTYQVEDIVKVLNQPEELMDYADAVEALSELPSEPDMATREGRLSHTRRILLLKRIEELEKQNAK